MDRTTKRVLIVAYLFPPIGGGGVQRALKMAKYLGQFGWEPHILTVAPSHHVTLDLSLLDQLPEDVKIHRASEIKIRRPVVVQGGGRVQSASSEGVRSKLKKSAKAFLKTMKNAVMIPDDQIMWYPAAVKKGLEVIREHHIDVIFSTAGPYTNHLVGRKLKQKTGKPWIADFRDPWTQNMHRPQFKWRRRIEERMEKGVMESSDVLLTVTNSFAKNFNQKYPKLKRVEVIHNGYDAADYQDICAVENPGKFTFIYAGIFYKERNPRLLLEAIRALVDEGKINKDHILLKFAGVFDYPGYTENNDAVQRLGLEENVAIMGNLPHSQVLGEMKGANVLLLINDVTPDAGNYIPGKLFEYMAIGNPILALSLPGESTEIIEKYRLGEVVQPKNLQEIKAGVLKLYEEWKEKAKEGSDPRQGKALKHWGSDPHRGNAVIQRGSDPSSQTTDTSIYERKNQAEQLARLMDELI
ncbi:glycosyltransferase family 4 protein [Anaerobacillus sp. CMMVII]|uniref:glycosyltransferase family 4 protein n=1 Tax=Anaerobacillus sp. CMMVII TaxID=2755588 RepID=UPI0021B82926|nr:glycosyltransferase family 4 protein [Anaerobacillus sp. CMMVII]MCT8140286.1 glycosyltransferase family 4 protein [Anaerobacillus sp. CMMVII]